MKRIALIALIAGALAIGGCGTQSDSTNSEAPAPGTTDTAQPVETSTVEAGGYGSDPHLDNLYDACESGDTVACDDLYLQSPVDSEYESFGLANSSFEEPPLSPEDQQGLDESQCALAKATEGMSAEEAEAFGNEIADEIIASEEIVSVADVLAERGITC